MFGAFGLEPLAMADTPSPFPRETPTPAPPPAGEVDVDSLRHRIGVQIGGTSYFQMAYRYRVLGGVYVDTGFFALNAGMDGSAGLLVDVPIAHAWSIYAGAGGGFAAAFGATEREGCDPKTTDCIAPGSSFASYVYGRVGASLRFGREWRNIVGVDVGVWRGNREDEVDHQVTGRSKIFFPMAGLSYHWAF
jgi:hypothetical protein